VIQLFEKKKKAFNRNPHGPPAKRWEMPFLDFSAIITGQYMHDKGLGVAGLFQAHFLHSSLRSFIHVVGLS
jgi:hypothetical protein